MKVKRAYDIKNKQIIIIERMNDAGAIVEYSLPHKPGIKFIPVVDQNGKNIEDYKIL